MQEKIKVIYEDKNFLAIYKPAGVLVHQVQGLRLKVERLTIVDWLLEKYPEVAKVGDKPKIRPGIVHRLDKDTSGLILIARNQKAFDNLKKLFQTRKIEKNYLALVYGEVKPKAGIIKKPIYLKPGTIKRTVWQGKMEKQALTEYEVLRSIKYQVSSIKEEKFSLLRVIPRTGRTHQIRVHLASIGHPIVGDSLYAGKKDSFGLKRLFLHAESLEFSQEDGKRIKIEAELPGELDNFLKQFRKVPEH